MQIDQIQTKSKEYHREGNMSDEYELNIFKEREREVIILFTIMFYHIVMVCFSNVNVYNMNIKETEIEIQRERAWYINENEARKTDSQKRKTPIDRQSDKERKLAKESNRQTGKHTGRQAGSPPWREGEIKSIWGEGVLEDTTADQTSRAVQVRFE